MFKNKNAIITGASSGKGRGKEILSVARTADLILVVLDTLNPQHLDVILKELRMTPGFLTRATW